MMCSDITMQYVCLSAVACHSVALRGAILTGDARPAYVGVPHRAVVVRWP